MSTQSNPKNNLSQTVDRRGFLKTSAVATSTFSLFTIAGTKSSAKVIGANDRINIGVAGINGRGGAHINEFAGMKDVEVTQLIDPDKSIWNSRKKAVKDRGGNDPETFSDIRKALEDKNVNAISVATTNHWHSLITIWACQAGKDVYVEKPISHNVFEGRKCVEAAKKYKRVVQHGTQNRSSQSKANMMAAIHSGKYGKLLVSKGYCCKPRWSIGRKPAGMAPSHLDWNLWLGPAPEQDFHGNMHPYNWHWFWDTGNGDIGNQGVHEMDIARWAIKDSTLPKSVVSMGGRYIPGDPNNRDQAETPNMQLAIFDYGESLLLFETRGLVDNKKYPKSWPRAVTNEFYTTDGVIKNGMFYPSDGSGAEKVRGEGPKLVSGGAFGSFINSVRNRKTDDNNAPAETAHYSAALCHLANASYRLGEMEKWTERPSETLGKNKVVNQGFDNVQQSLAAVGIDLEKEKYILGPKLEFDAAKEQFVDNPKANALITRQYRKPFVVPDQI